MASALSIHTLANPQVRARAADDHGGDAELAEDVQPGVLERDVDHDDGVDELALAPAAVRADLRVMSGTTCSSSERPSAARDSSMPPMSSMKNGSKPSMRAGRARTSPTASRPCVMDASVSAGASWHRRPRREDQATRGEVDVRRPGGRLTTLVGGAQHGGAGEGRRGRTSPRVRTWNEAVAPAGMSTRAVSTDGVRVEPVDEQRRRRGRARSRSRRRGSRPGPASTEARSGVRVEAPGRRPRPRCGPSAGRRGSATSTSRAGSAGVRDRRRQGELADGPGADGEREVLLGEHGAVEPLAARAGRCPARWRGSR